jgi:hypothetical protein
MRKEVLLIILLAVAVLALLSFSQTFNPKTEQDARKFFSEDLARNYPDADNYSIYGVDKIGDGPSSYFLLKAWVRYNSSTPCPTLLEVDYYYPPQSYLRHEQTIVGNCRACPDEAHCILLYSEEAVIASHTYTDGESVQAYLNTHPDAKPTATLLPVWTDSYGVEHAEVWRVDWAEPGSTNGISVFLSQGQNAILATGALNTS